MGDTKRPKVSDEVVVTKRWRAQDLNETKEMPATPSRRATLSMGAVPPPASTAVQLPPDEPTQKMLPDPVDLPPSVPMAPKMPTMSETLPPPTMLMASPAAGVELMVVEETQLSGGEKKAWRAAEVWTKRRVYGLDSTFKCVEILDRETGKPDTGHDMLGARLGGGRHRDKDTVRFSYPLPLPGMEAMFMKAKKHGYTSPVERMIVRVRVLVTSADEVMPSWDEIASRWSEPPPR